MAYQLQWTREGSRVRRHHKRESVRSPDDPNEVVILQDVADVSKARTWLTSNEMKSAMEKSGVLGSPSIRFGAAA